MIATADLILLDTNILVQLLRNNQVGKQLEADYKLTTRLSWVSDSKYFDEDLAVLSLLKLAENLARSLRSEEGAIILLALQSL